VFNFFNRFTKPPSKATIPLYDEDCSLTRIGVPTSRNDSNIRNLEREIDAIKKTLLEIQAEMNK